jgi:hypothetical protein
MELLEVGTGRKMLGERIRPEAAAVQESRDQRNTGSLCGVSHIAVFAGQRQSMSDG